MEERLTRLEQVTEEIKQSIDNLKDAYESYGRIELTSFMQDLPSLLITISFSERRSDKIAMILKIASAYQPNSRLLNIVREIMLLCHEGGIAFEDVSSGIITGLGSELARDLVTAELIAETYGSTEIKKWKDMIEDPPDERSTEPRPRSEVASYDERED